MLTENEIAKQVVEDLREASGAGRRALHGGVEALAEGSKPG